jgi:putative Holliday junction resolvase
VTAQTVLAFDFGERRIGVAVGNSLLREASPLAVLEVSSAEDRFQQIGKLIKEWHPDRLVVGVPTSVDGEPHTLTQRCIRFANQLQGRFGLPVERVDERYSSLEAEQARRELRAEGRWRASQPIDHLAAQVILQRFFEASHVD